MPKENELLQTKTRGNTKASKVQSADLQNGLSQNGCGLRMLVSLLPHMMTVEIGIMLGELNGPQLSAEHYLVLKADDLHPKLITYIQRTFGSHADKLV